MANIKYFEISLLQMEEVLDGTDAVMVEEEGAIALFNANGVKEDTVYYTSREAGEKIVETCKEAGLRDLKEEVRKGMEALEIAKEGKRVAALLRRHDGDFE